MPEIEISKLQVNGAGYLLVQRSSIGATEPGLFARAACDLSGLIGGEGIVYVTESHEAYCEVEVFTPTGTLQTFSLNAVIAAAIYNCEKFGRVPVQVVLPSGTHAVSLTRRPGNTYTCRIEGIGVFSGDKGLRSRLGSWLAHSEHERFVRSSELLRAGPENWILDVPHVSDRQLSALAKDAALNVAAAAHIPISMVRRLTDREAFMRTFVPDGHGLVTSCTSSTVAAAAALASAVPEDPIGNNLRIYGPSGAATVTVATVASRLTASVEVAGAKIYDGLVEWNGSSFEGMLEGDIDLAAMTALADQGDDEIRAVHADRFYTPLAKDDSQ